jgi:hypothetical protein
MEFLLQIIKEKNKEKRAKLSLYIFEILTESTPPVL